MILGARMEEALKKDPTILEIFIDGHRRQTGEFPIIPEHLQPLLKSTPYASLHPDNRHSGPSNAYK